MPIAILDASTVANNTPVFTLPNLDDLIVTREATLTTTGFNSPVVRGAENVAIVVDGALAATNSDAIEVGAAARITVGHDGFVATTFDDAIQATGSLRLNNHGFITGVFGIFAFNVNAEVAVVNTGTINASSTAVSVSGIAGAQSFTLDNSGVIIGRVSAFGLPTALRSTGIIRGNVSTGEQADIIDSSLGQILAQVFAGGGDDLVLGGGNRDDFDGGEGADTLDGGGGDDTLDGGAGADELTGGAGFDYASYRFASGLVASLVDPGNNTEDAAGDTYSGIEGLFGSSQSDSLTGDSLANRLRGGAGFDTLTGGNGNDTLYVDSEFDQVIEAAAGGTDTVISEGLNFVLGTGQQVEVLRIANTGGAQIFGNELAQRVYGSAGNDFISAFAGDDRLFGASGADTLSGGQGRDRLEGGAGNDVFYFFGTLGAANVDSFLDYDVAADQIQLDGSGTFPGLAPGALPAAQFRVLGVDPGTAAHRILYNPTIGAIYWDPDGSGAAASVLFATVPAGAALTAAEFTVV